MDENADGRRFWEHMGWKILEDNYRTMQITTNQDGNAKNKVQGARYKVQGIGRAKTCASFNDEL